MRILLITLACVIFSIDIQSQAISTQAVSINEVFYKRPLPGRAVRFIEIYNNSNAAVDLSDYKIEGQVYYSIPVGTTIGANSYLIIAENPSRLKVRYNIPAQVPVLGPWIGKLNLYDGGINLHNEEYCKIDGLRYSGWHEWPSTASSSALSIQKIHPSLPSDIGGSWASAAPTPGTNNSTVSINNPSLTPIIGKTTHSPNRPKTNDLVVISSNIMNTSQINNLSVSCEYQVVLPGQYIAKTDSTYNENWRVVPMNDNGINGDASAQDGIYTATLQAGVQRNRRLIRYRIRVNNNQGFNRLSPDQAHHESNYSYFVFDEFRDVSGIDINLLNPLQHYTLISPVIQMTRTDYSGTLVTQDQVYDHVDLRKERFYQNPRNNYRVDCNEGRPVTVQNDIGDNYKIRRDKLHFSSTQMNDRNSHGLMESIIFKIFELTGSLASYADYAQVRFLNSSDPTTDFQGLHVMREYARNFKDYNEDFLALRDLPDGNIHGYRFPFAILHDGELQPYGRNNPEFLSWNNGWDDLSDGCSRCSLPIPPQIWIEDNLNLDNHYRFMAAQEVIANNETNYAGQHNYIDYYNPVTDKWTVIPDDFNATFGTTRDENGWAPRSDWDATEDVRGPFKQAIRNYAPLKTEFENNIRSVVDLLCNTEQTSFLVENEVRKIYDRSQATNWIDADKAKWNQAYNNFETVIADYKNFFTERNNHLSSFYSNGQMPNKPTISYTGAAGFPINELTFSNSAFIDPQGNNTFAALEWRIAEWSDPANAVYQNIKENIYEITPVWQSGELTNFSNNMTLNEPSLIPGRTYRVRVRYKDTSGTKSLWSDPIEFIGGNPSTGASSDLVITELLYNAADSCGENFMELYNAGNSAVDASQFSITGDISFTFPEGTMIQAGAFAHIAKDKTAFEYKYNKVAIGQWTGELPLQNGTIKVKNKYDQVLDELMYTNQSPWPQTTMGFSIHLPDPTMDNSAGANWALTAGCGQPDQLNDILIDSDNDGVEDAQDQCPGFDDNLDLDSDGIPDGCDNDNDNDGVPDNIDACPGSDDSLDNDNDGIPDGCDTDADNDGVNDAADTCPGFDDNSDVDNDGIPDGCDSISYAGLIINELHYSPGNGTNEEFIEIVNTNQNQSYNLRDVSLAVGIDYTFDRDYIIPSAADYPQNYIVLAKDSTAFHDVHGFAAFDVYSGELHDQGEQIILVDQYNNEIDQLNYSSSFPWDAVPSNSNFSLGLIDQTRDNARAINWSEQSVFTTPGAVNTFTQGAYPDYSAVIINEIYYKPPGGNAEEFIEIVNTDPNNFVQLMDLSFSNGISYTFSQSKILLPAIAYPNNYLILANNEAAYQAAYPNAAAPHDSYTGTLSNAGELIKLVDFFGRTVDSIFYDDVAPWDAIADQGTHSLALVDVTLDNAAATSWKTQNVAATPGLVNTFIDSDLDGVFDFNDVCPGGDDTIDTDMDGVPDACDDCPVNVTNLAQEKLDEDISTSDFIRTNGYVESNDAVSYTAGNYILLDPSFEVKLGAVFTAIIEGCN